MPVQSISVAIGFDQTENANCVEPVVSALSEAFPGAEVNVSYREYMSFGMLDVQYDCDEISGAEMDNNWDYITHIVEQAISSL